MMMVPGRSRSRSSRELPDEWLITIKHELQENKSEAEKAPLASIFMAPSPLRWLKPDAFTPQVVAIGPYHVIHASANPMPTIDEVPDHMHLHCRQLEQNKDMLTHKIVACRHVAKNLRRHDFSTLVGVCRADVDRVRLEYGSEIQTPVGDPTSDDKLAHMMAVDGAFVVQILRCAMEEKYPLRDPDSVKSARDGFQNYYSSKFSRPLRRSILQDFILLENQVPLFVLMKVIQMDQRCSTDGQAMEVLAQLVRCFAADVLPFWTIREENFSAANISKRKHLLDCLYFAVTEEEDRLILMEGEKLGAKSTVKLNPTHFPSATELNNCGVQLKPASKTKYDMAITYDAKRAILYVPSLRVSDDTERLFRNLTAYESHLVGDTAVGVVSYLRFMNNLVDTQDDVALLVRCGILAQDIGSNHDVALMWNNLCVNTIRMCSQRHEEIAVQLTAHCRSRVNALLAEFKRTYVQRPWLIVSVMSGSSLLVMTFLIMYYTLLIYFAESGGH